MKRVRTKIFIGFGIVLLIMGSSVGISTHLMRGVGDIANVIYDRYLISGASAMRAQLASVDL